MATGSCYCNTVSGGFATKIIVTGLQDGNRRHRGRDGESGRGDGAPRDPARTGPGGIVACAKHCAGDGGTGAGGDQGDTVVREEELGRVHIAPYPAAVEAGVLLTVTVSPSSWTGEKCHAHRYLIEDVLEGEMRFGGFVLSDWNSVDPLADDYGEAAAMAVNAGIDMVMVPEGGGSSSPGCGNRCGAGSCRWRESTTRSRGSCA